MSGACRNIAVTHAVALAAGIFSLLLSPSCRADGYAEPGELVSLFHEPAKREAVANALKLSDTQRLEIESLVIEFRQKMQRIQADGHSDPERQRSLKNEYNHKIVAKLRPEQLEALVRISCKEKGGSALLDPTVSEKLQITEAQKQLLKQIESDFERRRRLELDQLPRLTATAIEDFEIRHRAEKTAAMVNVLDQEQRQQWEQLALGL